MRQLVLTARGPEVRQVPSPSLRPGHLLVQVAFSAISAGTELSLLATPPEQPLWRRALERARKLRRALRVAARPQTSPERAQRALQFVRLQALGYSVAGQVLAVGEGVPHFRPGDRVACAGAQCAFHADRVCVPWNLAVPVPASLPLEQAATVALGAVALHGLRQAAPQLGESVAVAGLGLLGNLCVQMFRAAGCRVVGWDPLPARVDLALALGLNWGYTRPDPGRILDDLGGLGVDAAVVAASAGPQVVGEAASLCRDRGRLVLLGNTPVALERQLFFARELELRITRSYGPGRYDPLYEEGGMAYPVGYVRWTETRNMAAYLDMLVGAQVKLEPLLPRVFPLEQGEAAYACLQQERPLLVVLDCQAPAPAPAPAPTPAARPRLEARPSGPKGPIAVALVGPGSFARQVHLPHLLENSRLWSLRAVIGRQGHRAEQIAVSLGTTAMGWEEALADDELEALVICTRHHLHAAMVRQALAAGKHVLVEKPLCLTRDELTDLQAALALTRAGQQLQVGFNRPFAPSARALKSRLQRRRGPALLSYRVQAGRLPSEHWIYSQEGGGRNLGEACHFYHFLMWLLDANARLVSAVAGGQGPRSDHFSVSLAFDEGSLATLSYTAWGDPGTGKEWLEACFDDECLQLHDFRELRRGGQLGFVSAQQDKGHRAMLEAFGEALRSGQPALPIEPQFGASELALQVEAALRGLYPV